MSSYINLSKLAPNLKLDEINPLTYCAGDTMDIRFTHGSHSDVYGQYSRPCQFYVSEYCAHKWDEFCEVASKDQNKHYPGAYSFCGQNFVDTPFGDHLVHETAARKYLVNMHNAQLKHEPFDPTVPNSPIISYWYSPSNQPIPEYEVNPDEIDSDPVMNKLLDKPEIAFNILINIYHTMKRKNKLQSIKNTKLGKFYNAHPYFLRKSGI